MVEQTEREAQLLEEARWREQQLQDELATERRHLRNAVGDETPSHSHQNEFTARNFVTRRFTCALACDSSPKSAGERRRRRPLSNIIYYTEKKGASVWRAECAR